MVEKEKDEENKAEIEGIEVVRKQNRKKYSKSIKS